MHNAAIVKILDEAVSDCFNHHLENSAPLFPEHARFVDAQKEFMSTLTEAQLLLYRKLNDNLQVAVDARESEYYYRLGFKDGFTGWRGVQ